MLLISAISGRAGDLEGVTAVASKASSDYVRTKLSDGSFQPESYAFGEGGNWGGEIKDATIDNLKFIDVARVIALPLAAQKYIPSRDPNQTKLLIMVYWGTTSVPGSTSNSDAYTRASALVNGEMHPPPSAVSKTTGASIKGAPASAGEMAAMAAIEAENRIRDKEDAQNAAMLGYDSWWASTANYRGTPLDIFRKDMLGELETNRYFVVLMAYDFQLLWKQKKHKELWETRFSISEPRNAFDKALPVMAQYASKYFGQDSGGLLREQLREGHVDIGELKSLGTVPDK